MQNEIMSAPASQNTSDFLEFDMGFDDLGFDMSDATADAPQALERPAQRVAWDPGPGKPLGLVQRFKNWLNRDTFRY